MLSALSYFPLFVRGVPVERGAEGKQFVRQDALIEVRLLVRDAPAQLIVVRELIELAPCLPYVAHRSLQRCEAGAEGLEGEFLLDDGRRAAVGKCSPPVERVPVPRSVAIEDGP